MCRDRALLRIKVSEAKVLSLNFSRLYLLLILGYNLILSRHTKRDCMTPRVHRSNDILSRGLLHRLARNGNRGIVIVVKHRWSVEISRRLLQLFYICIPTFELFNATHESPHFGTRHAILFFVLQHVLVEERPRLESKLFIAFHAVSLLGLAPLLLIEDWW